MDKIVLFFKNLTIQQWIIILVILVVVAIIVIYFKNKNKEIVNEVIVTSFPLKSGSSGVEVRKIQEYILSKNPTSLPVYGADGQWGSETQNAVIALFGKSEITEADYKNIFK